MDNYRIPRGAIKEGDVVNFRIGHVRVDKCILHLIEDKTDTRTQSEMKYINGSYALHSYLKKGLYWYFFEFIDGEEHTFTQTYQLNVYDKNFRVPEWLKGGIIYHIFVDRFCRKGLIPFKKNSILRYDWNDGIPFRTSDGGKTYCNDFFGGNLKGIISKLDYLKNLGVKCIYLSPIFDADSNHRYDANDHAKIDKLVGNKFELWSLCKLAKRKGIYVILDIALNHVGSSSKYFNDPKYDEWFTRYPDGTYDCWWNFPTLPSIKKDTPQSYKDHVTKTLQGWLKLGVKGFRLDVADELSNDLLKHIRTAVKAYDDDAVIFGEVWEDMSNKIAYGERKNYLEGDKLDSGMNYPFRNAILEFVKNGNKDLLVNTIETITTNYPDHVQHILMNMLSSHDEIRMVTYLENDIKRIKLAILLQMTLIGCPCIYYGDEVGMEGEKDPYNRKPMKWENWNLEIYNFYLECSNLRAKHEALRVGEIKVLPSRNGTLKFERIFKNKVVTIFVDINKLTYEVIV